MPAKSKFTQMTPDATVGQIIKAGEQAEDLLASIGFSPRRHEEETLRAACRQKHWDEEEVLRWLKKNLAVDGKNTRGPMPAERDNVSDWCRYMENEYLDRNSQLLEEIEEVYPRVRKIHGNQYIWLKQMHWHFEKLNEKLNWYMYFQRRKWFPLLHKLDADHKSLLYGTKKKIENSLNLMEEDQQSLLVMVRNVEDRSQDFRNPPGACSTFRILNFHLENLASSVRGQVAIERENLFPYVRKQLR